MGSEFTLDVPGIPVRVLIGGKEGSVGLMPPLGAALTDEQIAAVLTYVRREWGNTGTAVDAATVADVRKATAGRSRPWTDQELAGFAAALITACYNPNNSVDRLINPRVWMRGAEHWSLVRCLIGRSGRRWLFVMTAL